MASTGFVMTLPDEDEPVLEEEDNSEDEPKQKALEFENDFQFDFEEQHVKPWTFDTAKEQILKHAGNSRRTTVDDKISKLLKNEKKQKETPKKEREHDDDEQESEDSQHDDEESQSDDNDDEEDQGGSDEDQSGSDEDQTDKAMGNGVDDNVVEFRGGQHDEDDDDDDMGNSDDEKPVDKDKGTRDFRDYKPGKKKQVSFFAKPPPQLEPVDTFESLNLSRPLLKAISELGWSTPTPVQQQAIPIALAGRDIAGSAVTGSGKTAAFVLPILERLLYRDTRTAMTRVLILTPTRELAAQCHSVILNLAKYTNDIRAALVLGGLSLSQQTVELRGRPDIIVATPGRILDHLLNTQSFGLENLEILVLDEADRLLEMGFSKEITEIVKQCPKGRQTILFSATMTEKVSELAKLSLHQPVRVTVDPLFHTSKRLIQEFVRIRQNNEADREAVLLALCSRTFTSGVLVFCPQKRVAHRLRIIFGLAGLSAAEIHGNLTQIQRLDALEQFRDAKVNYLLATDVASRGLDIIGIQTVINFSLPATEAIYVHRVGRTARAGKKGRAISLVGDAGAERRLLKQIVKHSAARSCKHRLVPAPILNTCLENIAALEEKFEKIMEMEKEETIMRKAEMEATKLENLIKHESEIAARPARIWFMSEHEKKQLKEEAKGTPAEKPGKPEKPEKSRRGGGDEPPPPLHSLPTLKKVLTRKERKKKEAQSTVLSLNQYKLKKKKNAIVQGLKRKAEKQEGGPQKKRKVTNKKSVPKPDTSSLTRGKSNRGGNFKSKKRYKRR